MHEGSTGEALSLESNIEARTERMAWKRAGVTRAMRVHAETKPC
jgi:hypothetical protein